MTTTFDRLKSILLKTYPVDPETVTDDRPLEELGLDSLMAVELQGGYYRHVVRGAAMPYRGGV